MGIEINRGTIFKISEHSQSLPQLAPHQPFQNRTIPLAFRRASVCVCLYGFASVQNFGHTRLRHPCFACPSRCINHCHSRNHCKRTIIPSPCTTFLPPLSKVRCCRPKKFGRLPEGLLSYLTTIFHFSFFIFHSSFLISPLDTSQIIWYYNLNYSFKKNRSFSPFFYTYFINVFADIL